MATVKVKFRPSTVDGAQGIVYYQVNHRRAVRKISTDYHLYVDEWNRFPSQTSLSPSYVHGNSSLSILYEKIQQDVNRLNRIIHQMELRENDYTADDVVTEYFITVPPKNYLFPFFENLIDNLRTLGKVRTSETYATTYNSFRRFRENKDVSFDEFDVDLMMAYEAYLKNNGVCPNTSSFYMRNLRAVYNRAVEKQLVVQSFPFKHVYTGVDKTIKRAVSLNTIKRIKNLDLSRRPALNFARDMFLFSFYTRGMSFVDMAYLRKKDLNAGILTYRRRKTGQKLLVKWERCMHEIVSKYIHPKSLYLLPIIKPMADTDERKQYLYKAHSVNRSLKIIGNELGLSVPLTMYVARHAWASIAKSKHVPLSVISESMGHESETTTRIYLASLDTMAIDKANSMILKLL